MARVLNCYPNVRLWISPPLSPMGEGFLFVDLGRLTIRYAALAWMVHAA